MITETPGDAETRWIKEMKTNQGYWAIDSALLGSETCYAKVMGHQENIYLWTEKNRAARKLK